MLFPLSKEEKTLAQFAQCCNRITSKGAGTVPAGACVLRHGRNSAMKMRDIFGDIREQFEQILGEANDSQD